MKKTSHDKKTEMERDQVYSNTRVPTQVNTNQHESTQINTSPTRVNTNQHESDTSEQESKLVQHESNTCQHKSDHEIIIELRYRSW